MTPDITIPDAVVKVLRNAFFCNERDAINVLRAALTAWPGIKKEPSWELMTHKKRERLILPLTPDGHNGND